MILTRPSDVRALLTALAFTPSRILGQNFLIDGNILRLALDLADLQPSDVVLEIGPGLGVLTGPLLERVARVVAVEKDDMLHAHVQRTLGANPRLDLRHGDAMDLDLDAVLGGGVNKLVANLPYAIGTRLLVDIAASPHRPERFVVTVQREVAERMTASPGGKEYGVLALLLQLDYEVRLAKRISRSCFLPAPQIESALVVGTRRAQRRVPLRDTARYRALVKDAFNQRRKQIGTLVRDRTALAAAGIDPTRRPETIAPDDWCRLANALDTPAG